MLLHKLDKLIVNRTVDVERGEINSAYAVDIASECDIIVAKLFKTVIKMLKCMK